MAEARITGWRRPSGGPPLVLGHRGVRPPARGGAGELPPENTLEAFAAAADAEADGIELDVRPCATGELVVHHDVTLSRMTRGAEERAVSSVSREELLRLDLGRGARVPLLEDVLSWVKAQGLVVNVEMKRDVPSRSSAVRKAVAAITAYADAPEWILVSSFDPAMLALFGVLAPHVPRGFLFHHEQAAPVRSGVPARLIGAGAVHPERVLVTERRCRVWQKRGLAVNVWTVNDPDEALALDSWGVDAIITDDPASIGAAVRGGGRKGPAAHPAAPGRS